eukprot:CAMPEP_0202866194 /NCGR_PEP_ID=MMETSP1391-20130828/7254_1 /ASSEMBLY_ACC=CAM_ASM_000867 /TAXON_ID=1034604 /ORGANISM="Chlamydomonas leiostraca, Strain SAG 11-49" /LENGTH=116 /DNA_ID=CAMNT_0049546119 /DNA_START=178 /DNA_END=528 /DNA_ORIENTATION=+
MVQLMTIEEDHQFGPLYGVASVNLPDLPAPPANAFYCKTWSENEGLLEQMEAQGAVRVLERGGVPVNQWGSRAVLCELAWGGADMEVDIPPREQRARQAEDSERFLAHTYVMHLGM